MYNFDQLNNFEEYDMVLSLLMGEGTLECLNNLSSYVGIAVQSILIPVHC
jgi:hypothetical protein